MAHDPDRPPVPFSPRYGTEASIRNRLLARNWLLGTVWGRRTGLALLALIVLGMLWRNLT